MVVFGTLQHCCCFLGACGVTFPLCFGHCTALQTGSLSLYPFVWCVKVPGLMRWFLCAAMLAALHCPDDGGLASWESCTCSTRRALCPPSDGFQHYISALLRLPAASMGCAPFLVLGISGMVGIEKEFHDPERFDESYFCCALWDSRRRLPSGDIWKRYGQRVKESLIDFGIHALFHPSLPTGLRGSLERSSSVLPWLVREDMRDSNCILCVCPLAPRVRHPVRWVWDPGPSSVHAAPRIRWCALSLRSDARHAYSRLLCIGLALEAAARQAALRGETDPSPRKALPGKFEGFAGSFTKSMKVPSPVYPEHAPVSGWCDADPEHQIFVVLFTGRTRCVWVQASWGVQELSELVSKVSEVPTQKFYLTCDGMPLEAQDDLRKVTPHSIVLMRGLLVGGARPIIP